MYLNRHICCNFGSAAMVLWIMQLCPNAMAMGSNLGWYCTKIGLYALEGDLVCECMGECTLGSSAQCEKVTLGYHFLLICHKN